MAIRNDPDLRGRELQQAQAIARVLEEVEREVLPRTGLGVEGVLPDLVQRRFEDLADAVDRLDTTGCPTGYRRNIDDLRVVVRSIAELAEEYVVICDRARGVNFWWERLKIWLIGSTALVRRLERFQVKIRIRIDATRQAVAELERTAQRYGVEEV